jgi:sucrose-phosphate synthase
MWQLNGGPAYTFTGHSLGAQKLDRLLALGDQSLESLDDHYRFARRIAAEQIAMNHAARVITSTRQERHEQYGHPAYRGAIITEDDSKFTIIPPGVNLRIFDTQEQQPLDSQVAAFLDETLVRDIASDRATLPAIISSSRLDPKKNILGLVQAYASDPQLQQYANLFLVVRGIQNLHSRTGLSTTETQIMDSIVEIAASNDLWGKISAFPLNSQQELAAAYRTLSQRKSVFALTALYEPFGLAPLEAMAAGLPAVVTRNGGPSESLQEGGKAFGVLVDPANPEDIASGLLRLVGQENEWEAFHHTGRERVLTKYTWEQTARGYLEAMQNLRSPASTLNIPQYYLEPTELNDIPLRTLSAYLS